MVRRIVLVVLLLSAAAGGWLLYRVGPTRVLHRMLGGIEQWCGDQLLAIANDHLGPRLEWKRIAWVPPRGVQITGLTMTAGDQKIIEAASVLVDFARVPRRGEPIVIESVSFTQPVVRLIENTEGGLTGFDGFVKSGGGSRRADGGSTRLSDVLAIKAIEFAGGAMEYRTPGAPPMVLRPLDFKLEHSEAAALPEVPPAPPAPEPIVADPTGIAKGWYAFDAKLDLEPVAELDVSCRLDLDNFALDFEKLVLTTDLGPDRYHVFPPQIQQYLRDHEVRGDLKLTADGTLNPTAFEKSEMAFQLDLHDASMAFGSYHLPVQSLEARGSVAKLALDVSQASIAIMGGTVTATGWLQLDEPGAWRVQGSGRNLRLEQALREPGNDPRFSGSGAFTVEAGGSVADLAGTIDGQGNLQIEHAKLPAVQLFGNLLQIRNNAPGRDRASVNYRLVPRCVEFSDAFICGTALGIRGGGDLFYDGRLDMQVRAGMLERLDGFLGGAGKLFSALTGGLVSYRVQGTVEKPKVAVVPLGIGGMPAGP